MLLEPRGQTLEESSVSVLDVEVGERLAARGEGVGERQGQAFFQRADTPMGIAELLDPGLRGVGQVVLRRFQQAPQRPLLAVRLLGVS